MIRAFIALPVPESVSDALADWEAPIPGLLWIPAENHHLTLAFLGEIHPAVLADCDAALAAIRAPGFEVRLTGRGHFGGERPRILHAVAAADAPLCALRAKVVQALDQAGVTLRHERYRPHITLARPGRRDPCGEMLAWSLSGPPVESICWWADEFVLYRSELTPSGAIYTPLARYGLRDPSL